MSLRKVIYIFLFPKSGTGNVQGTFLSDIPLIFQELSPSILQPVTLGLLSILETPWENDLHRH